MTDDTRIRAALPTLKHVLDTGGSLVLMSHLGRPKGPDADLSLRHILSTLEATSAAPSNLPPTVWAMRRWRLRNPWHPVRSPFWRTSGFTEEKAGDEFFAGQLAENGDFYINDAFGTATAPTLPLR